MSGLYNVMGQFGGLFNNWQMNQNNQRMRDWENQRAQYEQDMDYWQQMNDYDLNRQSYDMWSTGASRGAPLTPRERPDAFNYNPPDLMTPMNFGGGFGMGGGQGGWSATPPPSYGGFSYDEYQGAGYTPPAAWDERSIDTAGMVDPSAVIAGAQPAIMEQMNQAFADAGNRFGSSGMVGTPYAGALGEASRRASTDIADITNRYQFQAASDAANREQQRALAEYQGNLNAWGQAGNWAHQGQMGDQDRGLAAWGQMGDWQYGAGQNQANLANQQWMAQNDWRFQDYQQQQNQMQQMLPLLMQMMGGGY